MVDQPTMEHDHCAVPPPSLSRRNHQSVRVALLSLLSNYRDIEELMLVRGVFVTYEAIRCYLPLDSVRGRFCADCVLRSQMRRKRARLGLLGFSRSW